MQTFQTSNRLLSLLLIITVTFVLSACNTKTKQEEGSRGTVGTAVDGVTGDDGGGTTTQVETHTTTETNTTTTTNHPKSLKLTITQTKLNKDANTTLKVEAIYSDNTTKDVTKEVEWVSSKEDAIAFKGHTLIAKKDGNITLQAKYQNRLSDKINLTIYWEVNGHRLPPEPDPVKNNATLLGIDVNNNGVRDDVERWIYETYKDKHPIYIDIAMQAARGYRLVLETPERAKEIRLMVNSGMNCGIYYQYNAKYLHEEILVHERIDSKVFSQYFNTDERRDIYWKYDKLLSGEVYDALWSDELKAQCDFNTSKYSKE